MKQTLTTTCARCGKPEIIAKTWVELIETKIGKSKLTHTQISCSDKQCQKMFDENREMDVRKKEELKMRNEAYAKKRKEEADATALAAK